MTILKRTKYKVKVDSNLKKMLRYGEEAKAVKLSGCSNYFVTNMGRVFSAKYTAEYTLIDNRTDRPDYSTIIWRELSQTTTKNGYKCVNLMQDKKRKKCYVHNLVFTTFNNVLVDSNVVIIVHRDKNKINNTVDNLQLKFKKRAENDYRNHNNYRYRAERYISLQEQ